MSEKFTLENVNGLVEKFEQLSEKLQKRIAWKAVKKGAGVIRDAAEANAKKLDAPARQGEEDSQIFPYIRIQKASKIAKAERAVAYRIGVEGQAIYEGVRVPPTYWRFVEFGTEKSRAQPFLRPAMEQNQQAAAKAIVDELWSELAKQAAKSSKSS